MGEILETTRNDILNVGGQCDEFTCEARPSCIFFDLGTTKKGTPECHAIKKRYQEVTATIALALNSVQRSEG